MYAESSNDEHKGYTQIATQKDFEAFSQNLYALYEAAKAVDGTVISPQFGPGDKGTDFNDVMLTKGLPAVKSIICTHLEQNCKHKKSHSR